MPREVACKILGVAAGASEEEVVAAYKGKLAAANGDEEKTEEIEAAYTVLTNQHRAEAHNPEDEWEDEDKKEGSQGEAGSDEDGEYLVEEEDSDGQPDLFELLRGQVSAQKSAAPGGKRKKHKKKAKQKPKLKPVKFPVDATLDDIYSGSTIKVPVTRVRICKACQGYIQCLIICG